jgi:uncharacterized protein YndB with AHSA1/START domain
VSTTPPESVVVEQRIRARRETVFAYFTDPDAYRRWMGDQAELEARPGGLYRVRFEDGSVAQGTYETVEPPSRIVFTWGWLDSTDLPPGSSRVEITLRQEGDETLVRLEHHGLPSDAWRREHDKGWHHFLGQLAVAEDTKEGQDADAQAHRR